MLVIYCEITSLYGTFTTSVVAHRSALKANWKLKKRIARNLGVSAFDVRVLKYSYAKS